MTFRVASLKSLDQVVTRRGLHNGAHLAGLQCEGGILELLLHIAFTEEAKITPLSGAAAIALRYSKVTQSCASTPDTLLMSLDDIHRLTLLTCDPSFPPACRSSTLAMLDK